MPQPDVNNAVAITIRAPRPGDREEILALIPRLRAFGAPPLRPMEDLDGAERDSLARALEAKEDSAGIFVAEIEATGAVAGVAYVDTENDYFTKEAHAHLEILSVAEAAEGRGVGRALLTAVEEWSRSKGYRFITLNVFEGNAHARKVYERAGYVIDTVKYVKEVG